jgi:eukaryotic-like serine/threonine-protein kinase
MNPERWQAVGELFENALALPASERTACVERASNGDDELRREVMSLLASHKVAPGGFVQEKIRHAVVSFHQTTLEGKQPLRVGPYRMIRELGCGGMGSVFLAERDDGHYKAEVAIKLVRPGMDTEFVLARFRRERQTLARLQHPNIARLLDGGTTESGLPYIVMEYIDGPQITKYARHKNLSIPLRVRLYLDVCSAVEYAHRNFVIHRDLKPGNILVDPLGAPKLLDFGICKLLAADHGLTNQERESGVVPMTPNYASPEQIRGEAVTSLSDVYSLGVVLYELLTGNRPYRFPAASAQEMMRAITAHPIPPPSASVQNKAQARQLAGDLDSIVMRALETDPQKRYASAGELADDLRRYFSHEPVRARPQTWSYHTAKFLRRYPKEVAAVVIVVLALSAGLAISIRQTRVANARAAQVRDLANKLVFDVHDAVRDLPGSTRARQVIVQTAIANLGSTAAALKGDLRAETELASAYRRLGDVQGNVVGANLGDPGGARISYQKGLALVEHVTQQKPSDIAAQTERLTLYHRIGSLEAYTGKSPDALRIFQNAIQTATPLIPSAENSFKAVLADIYIESCDTRRNMGDGQGSLLDANEALRLYNEIQASGTASPAMLQSLATSYAAVGMGEGRLGRLQDALGHYRQGAALMEKLVETDPNNASLRRDLMLAYGHIADVLGNPNLENLGDRAGALVAYRRAAEIARGLFQADPANEQAGADYGIALSRVATVMEDRDLKAKLAEERESLRVLNDLARTSPQNMSLEIYRAFVNQLLGDTLMQAGDLTGAGDAYSESVALADAGRKSGQISFVTTFVLSNLKLAQNAVARGHRAEALDRAQRAYEATMNSTAGAKSPFTEARGLGAMGLVHASLARSPLRQPGDRDQALSWLRKSRDAWQRVQSNPGFAAPHQREMHEVEVALENLEHR